MRWTRSRWYLVAVAVVFVVYWVCVICVQHVLTFRDTFRVIR